MSLHAVCLFSYKHKEATDMTAVEGDVCVVRKEPTVSWWSVNRQFVVCRFDASVFSFSDKEVLSVGLGTAA
ncbi:unnamed protein product [Ectocarpus sp. CCAP 1310/34]|nr:unnamed protein product [Ectocarpus sp. CCAP 1310/34]